MITLDIVIVKWEDHHSTNGWQDISDISEEPLINTSVGFLVKETPNHIILAQSLVGDGEQCGDIISILKKTITYKKEVIV